MKGLVPEYIDKRIGFLPQKQNQYYYIPFIEHDHYKNTKTKKWALFHPK